ncbi:hypothetical protein [Legionella sp. CNM-4043-24]|uniref:hypothetical protein n=1 Tax=Legionella sp. CNM-4043-24 TaxID=3421646 RepID=UPI00403AB771
MQSLEYSLQALNHYIRGGQPRALVKELAYYDDRIRELNRDFYQIRIKEPAIRQQIEAILRNLYISESKRARYLKSDMTVSDFLADLTSKGNIQVAYFLEVIEKKKSFRFWDLLMGGLLSLALVGGFLGLPFMSGVLSAITGFLSSSTGMPIIGMVFSGLGLLIGTYNNLSDKKKSKLDRARDLVFSLANAALTFAAYVLWLSSFPVMPLAGGLLFVGASVVDAIRETVCLLQDYIRYKNRPKLYGDEKNCANAQIKFSYKKHRNAAMINTAVALVLVGLIATWSFAPAGIGVTLGIVTAILVVCVVKYVCLKRNERIMRERLQTELSTIMADKETDNDLHVTHDEGPEHNATLNHGGRSLALSQVEVNGKKNAYNPSFFPVPEEDAPDQRLTHSDSISNRSSTLPTL